MLNKMVQRQQSKNLYYEPESERAPTTGRVSSRCPDWFAPHMDSILVEDKLLFESFNKNLHLMGDEEAGAKGESTHFYLFPFALRLSPFA